MSATPQPLFSICIPAYEDGEAVERALAHLFAQTCTDWECLVSDDSATDQVETITKRYKDSRVSYRRNTPPLGVPHNWNFLLAQARGKYVAILHQDDFYASRDVLETVAATFAKGLDDVVVCAYSIWQGDHEVARYAEGDRHLRHFLRDFPHRSLVINRLGHPSVFFLRSRADIPRFDAGLRYFLDTDWYARLLAGRRAGFVSSVFVGIEHGRKHQLSRSCLHTLPQTADELRRVLAHLQASPTQTAQACARFFAGHIRQWRHGGRETFNLLRAGFSLGQHAVFFAYSAVCCGHMMYRGLRKLLGFPAWR